MNFRIRFFRRHAAAIVAFSLAGTALQCIEMPLDPVAPTYGAPLFLTLVDITRTLEDMMSKDTSTVRRDNSGGYYFQDVQTGQPTGVEAIKVQPAPSVAQVALDTFQVAAVPSTQFGFGGSSFGLDSWPPPPLPPDTPFPGANATVPGEAINFSSFFEFLAIQRGTLTLNVTNTLPVTVKFERPILLKNDTPSDTTTIAVFSLDSLIEGESKSVTSDLVGKFVYGTLKTDSLSLGFSPRSGPFTVDPTDSLVFTFTSTPITVDSARAVIPGQPIASIDDTVIVIDTTVSLANASFSSGEFIARMVNNLDINVGIRLQFDNFRSTIPPRNVLTINRVLLPRETYDFPVLLDTLNIVNPTPDAVGTNMKFSVGIETINSGGQLSTVSSSDYVRAEFLPAGEFALKSVTGRIDPMTLPILSGASGADIGEAADKFSGGFTFDSVRIAVKLALTGGFQTDYNLVLEARNSKTGAVDSITLPPPIGGIQTTFDPSAGPAVIELGNSQGLNTFLQRFVPNFPDTFIVRGSVTINPLNGEGSIYDTTKLYQDVTVYFPLKFGLANGRMEELTPLNPHGTFPKKFVSDVRESALQFKITNHMPVGLKFRARLVGYDSLAGRRDTLLFIPSNGLTQDIDPAPVDGGGAVTAPVPGNFTITLSAQEVEKFNMSDSIFIRIDMQSTGNGVQAVRFRASDYVRVIMGGGLVYIVNRQD
ncbi:MAG: hypothetical protein A3H45_14750 [Ignavibacteria bacterium RIFCSPLOWO2_02_FULL_55_14]|nr:MAG: hypothetical protein A3C56_01400 [Ignavibacteria bacterium RIFCSPHIGHO2_02_FULL_56_12]OGU70463.1 MAG: hypothetical protein A3G43_03190 [Ignavibacteria bacterium RIFCSPLOWO2_12_FULL_56_21]OGU73914.1 MAG: hypothetical protein A3H45_14750 [Ignavibacteria bacterium RIFCSPLOWO2_02_FULL_55_14]